MGETTVPKSADKPTTRLAVLIDCDNVSPSTIDRTIAEAAKCGAITICRGYGDWTAANMTVWKDECHANSIQPIQQFRYTTGKNATDSALIIDAMDLLHGGRVEGFCIVSSDSDFTRLAIRIKEQGMFVMGVGKSHTPPAFVKACTVFVSVDKIVKDEIQSADVIKEKQGGKMADTMKKSGKGNDRVPALPKWAPIVARAIGKAKNAGKGDVKGWVSLGLVGNCIHEIQPDFDTGTYNKSNLSQLLKTRPDLFPTKGWQKEGTSKVEVKMVDSFPAAVPGAGPGKS